MILRAYKVQLDISNKQQTLLLQHIKIIFNFLLFTCKYKYGKKIKKISRMKKCWKLEEKELKSIMRRIKRNAVKKPWKDIIELKIRRKNREYFRVYSKSTENLA